VPAATLPGPVVRRGDLHQGRGSVDPPVPCESTHGQRIDVWLPARRDLARRERSSARHSPLAQCPSRSRQAGHRPTPGSSPRCIARSGTRTIGSKPTTADPNPGSARCAAPENPVCSHPRAGHASVQNLRRSHYEMAVDQPARHRLRKAFDELTVLRSELATPTERRLMRPLRSQTAPAPEKACTLRRFALLCHSSWPYHCVR
jgi:hypothetical protein